MSDSDISRIENAIKRLELVVEGRLTGVEKDIDEIIADHKSTRAKVNFIEGFLKKFEQPQYSKYKKTN